MGWLAADRDAAPWPEYHDSRSGELRLHSTGP